VRLYTETAQGLPIMGTPDYTASPVETHCRASPPRRRNAGRRYTWIAPCKRSAARGRQLGVGPSAPRSGAVFVAVGASPRTKSWRSESLHVIPLWLYRIMPWAGTHGYQCGTATRRGRNAWRRRTAVRLYGRGRMRGGGAEL
jgi:hypothetical protein